MSRAKVKQRLTAYEKARERIPEARSKLRDAVVEWRSEGTTVVEIAETLGWSRMAVYDLMSIAGPDEEK